MNKYDELYDNLLEELSLFKEEEKYFYLLNKVHSFNSYVNSYQADKETVYTMYTQLMEEMH